MRFFCYARICRRQQKRSRRKGLIRSYRLDEQTSILTCLIEEADCFFIAIEIWLDLAIETFWRLIVLYLNQWPIWKLLKNRYIFDICLGRVMCMRVSCEWKQSKQTKTEQTNNCIANRKRALVSLNYSELEPARARAKVIVLFCEQTVARRTKRNSTVTTCGVICELRPSQNVSFHRECAYGSCE